MIGPDCRELGVFNYNNRMLFTHDLLDDYTSSYTSSETPFAAWVAGVARRYRDVYMSLDEFPHEDHFRNAWFAYVNLQLLENDMTCTMCGPTPEDTIWDGVKLAFSQKQLLPSIRPPTITHADSPVRASRYVSHQQVFVDPIDPKESALLRRLVKKVIKGPFTALPQSKSALGDNEEGRKDPVKPLLDRVQSIPEACARLHNINKSLGDLFTRWFGIAECMEKPPDEYINFFKQVRPFGIQTSH